MDNALVILAANIQKYRKKVGLTQEALAEKTGVSFQAVSKWENAKSAPDILLLPILADLFGCYIDELFSREIKKEIHYDHCSAFPWNDDEIIRGVVCKGKKILTIHDEIIDKFTFELKCEAKNVKTHCNLSVIGAIQDGCIAGRSLNVEGNVSGGCNAGNNITVSGNISGGINCGDNVMGGGNISGDINCGKSVDCKGNINGNITCETIHAGGDVTAKIIDGNVTCNAIKCDKIIDGEINMI